MHRLMPSENTRTEGCAAVPRLFVVINHFRGAGDPSPCLAASTLFSASLSVSAAEVATVLVVDGSANPDTGLAAALAAIGVRYHHAGRRLSFAEGYNLGLSRSDQAWTVLCASDVYPSRSVFARMAEAAAADRGDTGCIIPALSNGDLGLQRIGGRLRRTVEVPLMTLNLNLFPTAYLRHIGGVPEQFGGSYNDVLLARRIRQDGRRILMVPDRCLHYGSLTIQGGAARDALMARDAALLRRTYPQLWQEHSLWHVRLSAFSGSLVVRAIAAVSRLVPARFRWRAMDRALACWVQLRAMF